MAIFLYIPNCRKFSQTMPLVSELQIMDHLHANKNMGDVRAILTRTSLCLAHEIAHDYII